MEPGCKMLSAEFSGGGKTGVLILKSIYMKEVELMLNVKTFL